jgi:CHAD domain-containing protein
VAIALGLPTGGSLGRVEVNERSSLGTVVRASIHDGLDRLLDHDYRLRLHRGDPPEHDIHQARVATRRLRSDLKTYRPVLDPVWVRHTRDELKWLGAALGSVRDLDVLRAGLARSTDGLPIDTAGQRELLSRLAEQRRVASRQLDFVLEGDKRYLLLLDRLDAARQAPPFRAPPSKRRPSRRAPVPESRARKALPPLVGKSWRSMCNEVRRAGDQPANPELHRIRIKAKQLRYASEAAAPVIGKPARRTAAAAEAVQTVLGEQHDAVTAEEWLWNEALGASPWGSFAAGQLTSEQRRRQRQRARRWRKKWKRLNRRKVRGWLE